MDSIRRNPLLLEHHHPSPRSEGSSSSSKTSELGSNCELHCIGGSGQSKLAWFVAYVRVEKNPPFPNSKSTPGTLPQFWKNNYAGRLESPPPPPPPLSSCCLQLESTPLHKICPCYINPLLHADIKFNRALGP